MDISISEKKLEEFIFGHLSGTNPIERLEDAIGTHHDLCAHRQFNLGRYGIADIVTIEEYQDGPHVTIYELKQGSIDTSALLQVLRYKKGILHYLLSLGHHIPYNRVRCVLIGNEISHADDFCISISVIQNLECFVYDICPNTGLFLDEQFWTIDSANFPNTMKSAFIGVDYNFADNEAEGYKNGVIF